MKVTVKLFASLGKYLPEGTKGRQAELTLAEGATVGDALTSLGVPREAAPVIMVNGASHSWETPLVGDETITVFPPVTGGSRP